jgi:hypothetical protein
MSSQNSTSSGRRALLPQSLALPGEVSVSPDHGCLTARWWTLPNFFFVDGDLSSCETRMVEGPHDPHGPQGFTIYMAVRLCPTLDNGYFSPAWLLSFNHFQLSPNIQHSILPFDLTTTQHPADRFCSHTCPLASSPPHFKDTARTPTRS